MNELRSVLNTTPNMIWHDYVNKLKLDWIFDKTYEKAFLVALLLWGIYNVWRVIWG